MWKTQVQVHQKQLKRAENTRNGCPYDGFVPARASLVSISTLIWGANRILRPEKASNMPTPKKISSRHSKALTAVWISLSLPLRRTARKGRETEYKQEFGSSRLKFVCEAGNPASLIL